MKDNKTVKKGSILSFRSRLGGRRNLITLLLINFVRLATGQARLATGQVRLAAGQARLATGQVRLAAGQAFISFLDTTFRSDVLNCLDILARIV